MKIYIIAIYLVFGSVCGYAQSNYSLIGEGKENNISLLWSVSKWEKIDGVVIKRRYNKKDNGKFTAWETLTKEPLKQYNQLSKSLNNTSNSSTKTEQLITKRSDLTNNTAANSTSLSEVGINEFSEELQDDDVLKMMGLMFSFDFDIALMYGFGYIDFDLPKYHTVEYGLFTVKSGVQSSKEVAAFKWIKGSSPDIEIEPTKNKIKRKGKNIHLSLYYDGKEMDSKNTLVGFNIFRSINSQAPIRINEKVIWLNRSSNKRLLYYKDEIVNTEDSYNYQIVPVSIFKNEGKGFGLSWSKLDDVEISAPNLYTNQHENSNFLEEGVELNWDFKEEQNNRIKGFLVQRIMGNEAEFTNISDTLPVELRSYIDNTLPKNGTQKFQYRVIALQEESYPIWSNVLRIYNNPKPFVSEAITLNAEAELNSDDVNVKLDWTADQKYLDGIKRFVLYCDRSGGILARETTSLQKQLNYTYTTEGASGRKYMFTVKSEYMDGEIANYTDTIDVIVPSKSIPFMSVWPYRVTDKNLSFDWNYPDDIADLKGFRVYLNGTLYKNEDEINAQSRTFVIENMEAGKYQLEMEAVTSFGVVSKKSKVLNITIK